MKEKLLITIMLIFAIFIAGCSQTPIQEGDNNENKPVIVASFYPTEEIAKNIVGNTSQVSVMVPQGADPHSYEPSPKQIQEFSQADVFITMGGILESIEEDIVTTNPQITQIDASHNVELIKGEEHDHEHHSHEEHSHEEHSHEDEHNHEEEHEHESHSKDYVEVEFHEDENALAYHLDINLPTPCHRIIETSRNEDNTLYLNIELQNNQSDIMCAQVIEEVHHEGEIELTQEIEEFIIRLDNEVMFEKHLEDIKHHDENNHKDEHNEEEHSDEEHTHEDEHNHDHGEYDPHTWLSIENMKIMTQEIEEQLSEQFPENSEQFSQNAQEYISKLENLQTSYESTLNSCQKDVVIVNHKAFGYLAHEFEFEQVSVAGFSPRSEPTPQTIQNVIDTARENDVSYIFSEGQFDTRVAQTIAQDIEGEVLELNPLLQQRHSSYIDLMEENLEQLAIGLECEN